MPTISIASSLILLVFYLSNSLVFDLLCFDRLAIAQGEWWRLFTCHLVHTTAAHLAFNVAGLLLLGALLEPNSRRPFLGNFLVAAAGISSIVFLFSDVARYCGLSGILNAWIVVLFYRLWNKQAAPLLILATVVYCVKLTSELMIGDSIVITNTWPMLPLAHISGMLMGLLYVSFASISRLFQLMLHSRHNI